jgi:hypothetical protein
VGTTVGTTANYLDPPYFSKRLLRGFQADSFHNTNAAANFGNRRLRFALLSQCAGASQFFWRESHRGQREHS